MKKKLITLVAGGTGGHIFPACALGEELLKRGFDVAIFTDKRGTEYPWNSQFNIRHIPSVQMRDSLSNVIRGILNIFKGFFIARTQLRHLKPAAVVGFGGYASLTTIAAAASSGIPTMIHQADALLGRVNRLLAPYVSCIATSFENTLRIKPSLTDKVVVTGLPLRKEIQYTPFNEPQTQLNILVTGGSQGAKFFGDILPKAVKLLSKDHQSRLVIAHQCRPECLEDVQAQYAGSDSSVELEPFFKDMATRYKTAQLIVSRAGASSVLEAATVGRPALLIPYPYASDDHQTANAEKAVEVGGAWCIQQKNLTSEGLAQHLEDVLTSPWKLTEAADKIRQIAIPHGEQRMAQALQDLIDTQKTRKHAA